MKNTVKLPAPNVSTSAGVEDFPAAATAKPPVSPPQAPPVPPPLPHEIISGVKPDPLAEVSGRPALYVDRQELEPENKRSDAVLPGMVPLKEVLEKHPSQSKTHLAPPPERTDQASRSAKGQPASAGGLQSILATPIYRRAIASGVSGGFLIVLALLFLQVR